MKLKSFTLNVKNWLMKSNTVVLKKILRIYTMMFNMKFF